MKSSRALEPIPEAISAEIFSAYSDGLAELERRHAPDGLLYHYCDANALLSIFHNRQVWATDSGYLNDTTELVSLFGGLESHLSSVAGETAAFVRDRMLILAKSIPGFRKRLIGMASHVACFSDDGDVLSQWRAYGANGQGFAIGFDPKELKILADRPSRLKRMSYGGSVEQLIVLTYFNRIVAALEPLAGRFEYFGFPTMDLAEWLQLRMSEFLHEFAFECKHPAFHEEREWRIMFGGGDLRFRAAGNRLVPYTTLDMSSVSDPNLMPVREIVIGPCAEAFASERVLTYLAESLGYGHSGISFRTSDAPYRQ